MFVLLLVLFPVARQSKVKFGNIYGRNYRFCNFRLLNYLRTLIESKSLITQISFFYLNAIKLPTIIHIFLNYLFAQAVIAQYVVVSRTFPFYFTYSDDRCSNYLLP